MFEYEILENVPSNAEGLRLRMNEMAGKGYAYKGHIYDMMIFERVSAAHLEAARKTYEAVNKASEASYSPAPKTKKTKKADEQPSD